MGVGTEKLEKPESRQEDLGWSKYRHLSGRLGDSGTAIRFLAFKVRVCGTDLGAISSVHLNLIVV